MRTTVTIDRDVERQLKQLMHRTRKSFKQALNDTLRTALSKGRKRGVRKPFKIKARPMHLRTGLDPGRLNQLADDMEVDAFLEITRRQNDNS